MKMTRAEKMNQLIKRIKGEIDKLHETTVGEAELIAFIGNTRDILWYIQHIAEISEKDIVEHQMNNIGELLKHEKENEND